jgi:predicted amidohydrolase
VENIIFQGGKEFPVFDTFVGKIGPIICADLEYPESVRVLALKGAEIITMSTAWGMNPRTDYSGYKYDLLSRANAVMNGVWMVMADQVGSTERSNERCFGHSRIIDPKGKIIAGIGYEEGLVTAKVDIKEGIVSALRRFYLGHRHPECYKIITSEV